MPLGTSAWPIPDLWAGVIPIVATADKYVSLYWENGRNVPFYFVAGELDGDKIGRNSVDWDRYLTKHSYDVIVVEYRGRGHEHFQDEIHRLFQWMELHRRNFFPREFAVLVDAAVGQFLLVGGSGRTCRPALGGPAGQLAAARRRAAGAHWKARCSRANRVSLTTGARQAKVWLAPEMVDFSKRISVSVNGRSTTKAIEPSAEVAAGGRPHPRRPAASVLGRGGMRHPARPRSGECEV